MKKITIENNQKNAKWSSAVVEVPATIQESADKFFDGDIEKAGNALLEYATSASQLAVSVRGSADAQASADAIFSGQRAGGSSTGKALENRLNSLVKEQKISGEQLVKLAGMKTIKEKNEYLDGLKLE